MAHVENLVWGKLILALIAGKPEDTTLVLPEPELSEPEPTKFKQHYHVWDFNDILVGAYRTKKLAMKARSEDMRTFQISGERRILVSEYTIELCHCSDGETNAEA